MAHDLDFVFVFSQISNIFYHRLGVWFILVIRVDVDWVSVRVLAKL